MYVSSKLPPMGRSQFTDHLRLAASMLQAKQADLAALGACRDVIVYAFGACGKNLAHQLRAIGVNCVIYDNSKSAVASAAAAGFDVTARLDLDLPVIVAAGQHQNAILGELDSPAFSLVEALYAFDLVSSYGRARPFADGIRQRADELYDWYSRIDPACRSEFLSVLQFRASLEVLHLAGRHTPVSRMWVPPKPVGALRSFCDVGAYDGDTLASMKSAFPGLISTCAIEPNPDLVAGIEATAARLGLANRTFQGVAWSGKARLSVDTLPNGMMVVTEDPAGRIDADALDHIVGNDVYEYVKFDVEGSEIAALDGARALLRRARCVAVASYHYADDLVDIPNHVAELIELKRDKNWKCAFHHYSECMEDSIFYFYR
jgi:FkbM family methyltransferase